jgi:hypothetical protein
MRFLYFIFALPLFTQLRILYLFNYVVWYIDVYHFYSNFYVVLLCFLYTFLLRRVDM